jgi:hypothetical protein
MDIPEPSPWGSQSWLQPAFSRRFSRAKTLSDPKKPPERRLQARLFFLRGASHHSRSEPQGPRNDLNENQGCLFAGVVSCGAR